MYAHLLKAALRSVAVTVVLGCILIYATGGIDSSYVRGMAGVIAVCFFLFWMTFFFMFGPRVPMHDGRREDSDLDNVPHLGFRGRRREIDERETEMNQSETGGD